MNTPKGLIVPFRGLTTLITVLLIFNFIPFETPISNMGQGFASGAVITVDSGGGGDHLTIQQGIDNATLGDTVRVLAGYYRENLIVTKTITLQGAGPGNTTIDGGGSGATVTIDNAAYVNITGFSINGSGGGPNAAGISVLSSFGANISGNILSDNTDAILFDFSDQCTISNNTIYNTTNRGMYLLSSDQNTILSNDLTNCTNLAIYLRLSNNNNVTNNIIDFASGGISLDFSATGNRIYDNDVSLCPVGLSVTLSIDNDVANNSITSCGDGIFISGGIGNSFSQNMVSNSSGSGIDVSSIDGVQVYNNTIWNGSIGVQFYDCVSSSLANNSIFSNTYGLHIFDSTIIVENNSVMNNTKWGIWLDDGSYGTIPSFKDNQVNGIQLSQSYYYQESALLFQGLSLDGGSGNGYVGNFSNGGLLNLFNCSNIGIQGCRFGNNTNAVLSKGSSNMVIDGLDTAGVIPVVIDVSNGSDIDIRNSDPGGAAIGDSIVLKDSDGILLQNNSQLGGQSFLTVMSVSNLSLIENDVSATTSDALTLGASGYPVENIIMTNTTISGALGNGLTLSDVLNCSIHLSNISGCQQYGVECTDSTLISIVNSSVSNSGTIDLSVTDSDVLNLNTTILDGSPYVSSGAQLHVQWLLDIKTENLTGAPLATANITMVDSQNGTANCTTDNDGWCRFIHATEYIETGGVRTNHTPYNITANRTGHYNITELIEINRSLTLVIQLEPHNRPPLPPANITPIETHNRTPRISWVPAIDPEGGFINYTISIWNGTNSSYPILVDSNTTSTPGFNITTPLMYHHTYFVEVNATDPFNATSFSINGTFSVVNHPPGQPTVGLDDVVTSQDDIVCTILNQSEDVDTDPVDTITYDYLWFRNGIFIPSLSVNETTSLFSSVPASITSVGEQWKCSVVPGDEIDHGLAVNVSTIVVNSAPSLTSPLPVVRTDEDVPLHFHLDMNLFFTDMDDDILTFYSTSSQDHVNLSFSANGSVTFIPQADWSGNVTVDIVASDGTTSSTSNLTIEVAPLNDPPAIEPIQTLNVWERIWYNNTIFSATDVDGDELTFELDILDHIPSLSEGVNYTLDPRSGALELLTDNSMVGSIDLNLSVSDGNGSTAVHRFTLKVSNSNDPPLARIDGPGNNTVFPILSTVDLLGYADDPDLHIPSSGETLTYEWLLDQTYPIGSEKEVRGFRLETGGDHTISFIVSDGKVSSSDSISITVEHNRGVLLTTTVDEIFVEVGTEETIHLTLSNMGTGPDHITPVLDPGTLGDLATLSQEGIPIPLERLMWIRIPLNITIPEGTSVGDHVVKVTATSSDGMTLDSIEVLVNVVPPKEPTPDDDSFLGVEPQSLFCVTLILVIFISITVGVFLFWNRRIRKVALEMEAKKLEQKKKVAASAKLVTLKRQRAPTAPVLPAASRLLAPSVEAPLAPSEPEPEIEITVKEEAPKLPPILDRKLRFKKKFALFLGDIGTEDFDISDVEYSLEEDETGGPGAVDPLEGVLVAKPIESARPIEGAPIIGAPIIGTPVEETTQGEPPMLDEFEIIEESQETSTPSTEAEDEALDDLFDDEDFKNDVGNEVAQAEPGKEVGDKGKPKKDARKEDDDDELFDI